MITVVPLIKVDSGARDSGVLHSATQLLGPMPPGLFKHWKPEDREAYVDDQGKALDTVWQSRLPLIDMVFVHLPLGMTTTELYCFYDFIRVAVQWMPEDRWSVDELLKHKWVTIYLKGSGKLEDYDWSMMHEGKWSENVSRIDELQIAELERYKARHTGLQKQRAEKAEPQKAELQKTELQNADLEKLDISKDVSNLEK
jgi:hypothetical protein